MADNWPRIPFALRVCHSSTIVQKTHGDGDDNLSSFHWVELFTDVIQNKTMLGKK